LGRTLVIANNTSLTLNSAGLGMNPGAVINNAGTIDSQGDDCICNNGAVGQVNNSGTLKKSGGTLATRIQANLADTGGTVSVQTGFLALSGTFSHTSKSKIGIRIAGTSPGTDYGQLQVSGAAPIVGTLALTTNTAFGPVEGQTFNVITYGSHSGTKFKAITGQVLPSPSDLGYAVGVGASAGTLTLKHAAEMSVAGTGPTNPVHGSPITYTETATNNGRATANGVKLTDTLPAGVTGVTASTSQGTCTITTKKVICNIGTLANGASATVTIHATAPGTIGTTLTNKAAVAANELDVNTKNNSATQKTTTT
jgi:uncharacterized repeat protein (TIGR01451 family)